VLYVFLKNLPGPLGDTGDFEELCSLYSIREVCIMLVQLASDFKETYWVSKQIEDKMGENRVERSHIHQQKRYVTKRGD